LLRVEILELFADTARTIPDRRCFRDGFRLHWQPWMRARLLRSDRSRWHAGIRAVCRDEVACPWCGTVFWVERHAGHGRKRFCSGKCQGADSNDRLKREAAVSLLRTDWSRRAIAG
jgi:endogenous inhibitor of DNA gyrase (YacG/DUF329 family)